MNIQQGLFYAKSHEWADFQDSGICRVGISDFAQAAMGDIVFVNLPNVGERVTAGEALTDIESVKAVADVFSPVSGTIVAVNEALDDAPELLNSDPYGAWIAEIEGATGREGLMDAAEYEAHCAKEEEA